MIYVKQWVEAFGISYPEYGDEPDDVDDEIEFDEAQLIESGDEPESIETKLIFPDEF